MFAETFEINDCLPNQFGRIDLSRRARCADYFFSFK